MKKQNISNLKKGFTLIEMVVSIAVFLLISGVAVGIFLSIINRQKGVLSEQELLNQISYAEEYMSRALRMAKTSTSNTDITCLSLGNIYVLTSPETAPDLGQTGFYKGIKFLNQTEGEYVNGERNAMCEELFLDNTTDPAHPVLMIKKGDDLAVAITSPNMKINYVKFGVNGLTGSSADCTGQPECPAAISTDEIQPRVTILLGVFMPGNDGGSGISCTTSLNCPTVNEGCDNGKCRPIKIFQTTVSQRNLNVNVSAQP